MHTAIIPEIAAAVAKLMSNKDLVLAAAKIRNVTRCRNTMGERGVLGTLVACPSARRPSSIRCVVVPRSRHAED